MSTAKIARREPPVLSIVLPCFNEVEVLPETAKRLIEILDEMIAAKQIKAESFLYFVNDGSSDGTWAKICELGEQYPRVKGLSLSRNFGHQNALFAGLSEVKDKSDVVITMDSDLQHDETALPEFIAKYRQGADIVFGIREDRGTDSQLKKFTALFFYKFMKIMGVKIIKNHADYRLSSRRAIEALLSYSEVNLFLRGLFIDLGFKTDQVIFKVKDRFAGKSKYSWHRMFSFALKGITSFTITPLRIVTVVGFLIFLLSAGMGVYVIHSYMTLNIAPGWASTVLPIYFIGGVQIICIGVLGEYIGRIYMEAKGRPRYIKQDEVL